MNRAFRITYDYRSGKFVIEIQGFAGLTWSASRDSGKARYFETFDAASAHVKSIGLDRVYQDFTFKAPFGSMRGELLAVTPKPKTQVWTVPYSFLNKEQA